MSKLNKRKFVPEADSEDEDEHVSKKAKRECDLDQKSHNVETKADTVPAIVIDIGFVVNKDLEFRTKKKGFSSGFLYRFQPTRLDGQVWIGFAIWTNETLLDHLEQIAYRIKSRYKQDVQRDIEQTWHETYKSACILKPVRDGGIWHDLPKDLQKRSKILKKMAKELAETLGGKFMNITNFDKDKVPRSKNLLKDRYPEIFKQIHPTKNRGVDINKLTCKSGVKLLWLCTKAKCKHHIWLATVASLTAGQGCSFCAGKRTCKCDSFGQLFPDLLKEFVAAGNNRKLAFTIPTGAAKTKFKWKCLKAKCDHHIWSAAVKERTRGQGCSNCAGKQTCKCDSFGHLYPKLLEEFVAAGNDRDLAFTIAPGSSKDVTWKCSKAKCDHHVWSACPNARIGKGNGCGWCSSDYTCKCDSFGHLYPKLLEEFVAAGNDRELAFTIAPGSGQKFKWKCSEAKCNHHIWPTSVAERTRGRGCSYCTSQQTCECDSFGKRFNWKCSKTKCGNVWPSIVYNRTKGFGCPKCKESRMEKQCSEILDKRKLDFIPQKTFDGLKHKKKLQLDRYITLKKAAIELDGRQHFEIVTTWDSDDSNLKDRQIKDQIKNDFCKNNGIHLLRIAPSRAKDMEVVIDEFLRRIDKALDGERIETFIGDEYQS